MSENSPVINMRLELVPVPVSDVDRAIDFYVNKVGFQLDHDIRPNEITRVVQLTPPGSSCSILLSLGLPEIKDMEPGSAKALHLVVDDVRAAREALVARGIDCGGVDDMGGILYVYFQDPDGSSWLLQEIPGDL